MSEKLKGEEPAQTPSAPPSGERVTIAVGIEDGKVVMRFGTGTLAMPAAAALGLAERLRDAAHRAEPPASDVAKAALAVEGAIRGSAA